MDKQEMLSLASAELDLRNTRGNLTHMEQTLEAFRASTNELEALIDKLDAKMADSGRENGPKIEAHRARLAARRSTITAFEQNVEDFRRRVAHQLEEVRALQEELDQDS